MASGGFGSYPGQCPAFYFRKDENRQANLVGDE
ncbi:hypothetical protein GECvBGOT_gp200 [Salmonella phage GEC_vB_GOT]|nr:hypothetical protein GECvBGOT_gp200 [Salmonella phage GEC_vB_GOT]